MSDTNPLIFLAAGGLAGVAAAIFAPDSTRKTLAVLQGTGATDAILNAASAPIPELARVRPLLTSR